MTCSIFVRNQLTFSHVYATTAEVHQVIDFYLYGADGQKTSKRSDVAIIITTPDYVPNLALFADRPDKSTPAGGLNPGIAIVMYLQDTREIRIQTPLTRAWLMDDVLEDVNKVLETTRLQPRAGFKIQAILGQPARLAPRTPDGTGIGIAIKFWLQELERHIRIEFPRGRQ